MARPLDAGPAWLAVIHALTKFTGQPQCIPKDRLFKEGFPADALGAGPRGGRAYGRKTLFFAQYPDEDPLEPNLRMQGYTRVRLTFPITCWYYGHELHSAEYKAAMLRMGSDRGLIYHALTYAGALQTDPDGNDTGLAGYSMPPEGWKPGKAAPIARSPRVIEVRHVFTTTAEFAQPSNT